MISKILTGIFNLVISLVNLLLVPIDSIISSALPELGVAIDFVAEYFSFLANLLPWAMSWIGLNTLVIELFVAFITFKLSVPLLVHTIKLAIKWYDKLKP